jgi:hypothetical protein
MCDDGEGGKGAKIRQRDLLAGYEMVKQISNSAADNKLR